MRSESFAVAEQAWREGANKVRGDKMKEGGRKAIDVGDAPAGPTAAAVADDDELEFSPPRVLSAEVRLLMPSRIRMASEFDGSDSCLIAAEECAPP